MEGMDIFGGSIITEENNFLEHLKIYLKNFGCFPKI